jgi:hypothetical protein
MSKNLTMATLDAADLMAIEGGRGHCHGGHHGHHGGGGRSLLNQLNQAGVVIGQQGTNNGTVNISGNVFNFNF